MILKTKVYVDKDGNRVPPPVTIRPYPDVEAEEYIAKHGKEAYLIAVMRGDFDDPVPEGVYLRGSSEE